MENVQIRNVRAGPLHEFLSISSTYEPAPGPMLPRLARPSPPGSDLPDEGPPEEYEDPVGPIFRNLKQGDLQKRCSCSPDFTYYPGPRSRLRGGRDYGRGL